MSTDPIRQIHDAVVNKLADDGKLMEAGFHAMRASIIPPGASKEQIDGMRIAYFAGAQHLYASMMTFFEAGDEPTEKDLRRMGLIDAELRAFEAEMHMRDARAQGTAQ